MRQLMSTNFCGVALGIRLQIHVSEPNLLRAPPAGARAVGTEPAVTRLTLTSGPWNANENVAIWTQLLHRPLNGASDVIPVGMRERSLFFDVIDAEVDGSVVHAQICRGVENIDPVPDLITHRRFKNHCKLVGDIHQTLANYGE